MTETLEVSPEEVCSRLAQGPAVTLVDIREPEEFRLARIDGCSLVPMGSIPAELPTLQGLAGASDLMVICHHGVRSLQAVHWLRQQGVENCFSVAGGIDRWSREIDPQIPRY